MADRPPPWSRVVAEAASVADAAKRKDRGALITSADKLMRLIRPNGESDVILTTEQVAQLLQIHVKTAYKHAKEWPFMQKLPGTSLYRAHRSNIEAHIKACGEPKRAR